MLNTSKSQLNSLWIERQEALIASLRLQPLVIVLRPSIEDLEELYTNSQLFLLIEILCSQRIKHIEIAWSPHPGWTDLILELRKYFSEVKFGAASITNAAALTSITELGIEYAMTPFWDPILQNQARESQQVLVPGVFSPTEIHQAISFGNKVIKLFPAAAIGIKYLHQIKALTSSFPFVIAAGGLTTKDLNPWLKEGYDAIAIGRKFIVNQQIDNELLNWLDKQAEQGPIKV